jgi:hypothetical protein
MVPAEVIALLLGQFAVLFIILLDEPMTCDIRYPYAYVCHVIAW